MQNIPRWKKSDRGSSHFRHGLDPRLDISTKEQLCVIVRLDKGCDIVERFLKFHNVSTGRTAPALSEVVKNVLI